MELKSKAFCSASWTDINIDLSRKQIQHCCKAEFEKYTKLSHNFINNSAGILQRREESLKGINNEQCKSCWKNYAILEIGRSLAGKLGRVRRVFIISGDGPALEF